MSDDYTHGDNFDYSEFFVTDAKQSKTVYDDGWEKGFWDAMNGMTKQDLSDVLDDYRDGYKDGYAEGKEGAFRRNTR